MQSTEPRSLLVACCTRKAAMAATHRWHYTKNIPVGKQLCIGVWERERFVGAVTFGMGAAPRLSRQFELQPREVCELTRIALDARHVAPVSKVIRFAIALLREHNPGIRVVVSFADPAQGHHGGIYQAVGWVYTGTSAASVQFEVGGHRYHLRSLSGGNFGGAKPDPAIMARAKRISCPGKHRYVKALDAQLQQRVDAMAQPYPKRAKLSIEATGYQPGEGGVIPTRALQSPG